jgi:hypothetical protein
MSLTYIESEYTVRKGMIVLDNLNLLYPRGVKATYLNTQLIFLGSRCVSSNTSLKRGIFLKRMNNSLVKNKIRIG